MLLQSKLIFLYIFKLSTSNLHKLQTDWLTLSNVITVSRQHITYPVDRSRAQRKTILTQFEEMFRKWKKLFFSFKNGFFLKSC